MGQSLQSSAVALIPTITEDLPQISENWKSVPRQTVPTSAQISKVNWTTTWSQILHRFNHSIILQKRHLVLDQEVPLEPHLRKQEVEIRVRVLCRPQDHSQGQLLEVKDRHQGKAQV